METIPSYFSQSGSLHTTLHSLDSLDTGCDNPGNKRKSSDKKEKPMSHESSRKKSKQAEFNRPKTNKGPKQSKAPANPITTLIAPGHYQAQRPGGIEGEEKHQEYYQEKQWREFKENQEANERFNAPLDYSSDLYRTMSRATLIDQESGEVYQVNLFEISSYKICIFLSSVD